MYGRKLMQEDAQRDLEKVCGYTTFQAGPHCEHQDDLREALGPRQGLTR